MQTDQPLVTVNFHILKPRKALNKAYQKVKPNRSQILDSYFLKKTYYDPLHYIHIKSREKENPTADAFSLETEIDRLVYELYGLTEVEIEIIERSF